MQAIDSDAGINAQLSYAITSGNEEGAFSVRPTGDLILTRQVDREIKEKYTLKISVSDCKFSRYFVAFNLIVEISDASIVYMASYSTLKYGKNTLFREVFFTRNLLKYN